MVEPLDDPSSAWTRVGPGYAQDQLQAAASGAFDSALIHADSDPRDSGISGGFYAHFTSKDSLVATVIANQLRALDANIVAQADPGRADLEQIVRWYLSPHHRDNPEEGCPNAALLDEIGRCADATRQVYTDGVLVVIDGLAARLAPHDPPSARVKALSLLGMLVRTLQLSRALTDRQLADELLEQGIRNALALLDTEQHN